MRFMNEMDISEARARYRGHPFLGPATATLTNLMNAANENSDGWAYWPKPARSAAKLMGLIEGADPREARFDRERKDATLAKLRAAYAPIKAFRTREKIRFDIIEVDAAGAPIIFAKEA